MEKAVLKLCGLWLWLTRKSRASRYCEVANTLASARIYLFSDYTNRASTRDRGLLLPHHVEALTILERHIAMVYNTPSASTRLASAANSQPRNGHKPKKQPESRSSGWTTAMAPPHTVDPAACEPHSEGRLRPNQSCVFVDLSFRSKAADAPLYGRVPSVVRRK